MRNRFGFVGVSVSVAVLFLAAACGGDDGEGGVADESAAGESAVGEDEASEPSGVVTVYTGRHYGIEPVFEEFTEATGIEVRFTTGKDPELRERLIAEGENTPADVIMTADAANIELAAAEGVLGAVDSEVLRSAIPEELRSPDDEWFSLSRRARVVIASTERVPEPPTTYAGVGDPQWKGRVCLRPSAHPYTQSLVASLIVNEGAERAEQIVASWVANEPLYIDSDTDIYEAVAAGDCDVAIANTYYLGRLQAVDPEYPVAIIWPEQDGRGAHVNVSTAALTAHAPNPDAGRALIEWLATEGQQSFTDVNFEYPADPDVAVHELVAGWGDFTADVSAVLQLGANQREAVEMLDRAGYQ
jgi:iron(III) transport system substrate-binding protein